MSKWNHATFELEDGTKIEIVHDIPKENGRINSLRAAFNSWIVRTENHTSESLASYISNKGVHEAYSIERFLEAYPEYAESFSMSNPIK